MWLQSESKLLWQKNRRRSNGVKNPSPTSSQTSLQPSSRILTINGGSSSIKFALFRSNQTLDRTLSGKIDRMGLENTTLEFQDFETGERARQPIDSTSSASAIAFLLDWLEQRIGLRRLTQSATAWFMECSISLQNGYLNSSSTICGRSLIATPSICRGKLNLLSPFVREHHRFRSSHALIRAFIARCLASRNCWQFQGDLIDRESSGMGSMVFLTRF